LYKHPAVQAAAVVAKPDDKWGETPCAFVELKPGATVTAADIIAHCKANLAGYKVQRHVVFGEVPKTSTGKIQKFKLRETAQGGVTRHLPDILRHLPSLIICGHAGTPNMPRAIRKAKSIAPSGFADEARPFVHDEIVRGIKAKRVKELIDRGVLSEKQVYRVIPSGPSSGGWQTAIR